MRPGEWKRQRLQRRELSAFTTLLSLDTTALKVKSHTRYLSIAMSLSRAMIVVSSILVASLPIPAAAQRSGPELPVARENQGLVVLIRAGNSFRGGADWFVFADDDFTAWLESNTWTSVFLPAGVHGIRWLLAGRQWKNSNQACWERTLTVEPGKTYFIDLTDLTLQMIREEDARESPSAAEALKLLKKTKPAQRPTGALAAQADRYEQVFREFRPLEWSPVSGEIIEKLIAQIATRSSLEQDELLNWATAEMLQIAAHSTDEDAQRRRIRSGSLTEDYVLTHVGVAAAKRAEELRAGDVARGWWADAAVRGASAAERFERLKKILDGADLAASGDRKHDQLVEREAARVGGSADSSFALGLVGVVMTEKVQAALRRRIEAASASTRDLALVAQKAAACFSQGRVLEDAISCSHASVATPSSH